MVKTQTLNRYCHLKPEEDGCERVLNLVTGTVYKEDLKTGQWYKAGFIVLTDINDLTMTGMIGMC